MSKPRVINLLTGPGVGKSTTCADLFQELKRRGFNTEQIPEYAKDAAWENRGTKLFGAQEYIFGKQSFRLSRVACEVEFAITDSPLLLTILYNQSDLQSLNQVALDNHRRYDSINIFLNRSGKKPYNPKGRLQTEAQANELDGKIKQILIDNGITFHEMEFSRRNPEQIIRLMETAGWIPKQTPNLGLIEGLRALTDEERKEIFSNFCDGCGSENAGCCCRRDE